MSNRHWRIWMPKQTRVPKEADRLAREVLRITAQSPGDRSVLRHSLGRPPESVAMGVHRIVAPLLPKDPREGEERAYYAVAALIASQDRQARDQASSKGDPAAKPGNVGAQETPDEPGEGEDEPDRPNLGYSLAQLAHKSDRDKSKTLGDRLELLARQDIDGLYRHLPRLILQVGSDHVRIDWGLLVWDLTRWAHDPRQVAKEWAQDYYRTSERLIAAKRLKAEQAASEIGNEEE
jgi:CRISPR system Cascade subunit CasB